jgi:succinate dehydrogenase/fumarate reductase flavoprotein subunit
LLDEAVRQRGIPVWPETRVVELLTDEGAVRGAVLEAPNGRNAVRAHRGVVLACGSFESDPEMRDTYLPLPLVSVGHPANTGDSMTLARQAGASLWHMSAFFGWLAFCTPEFPAGFTLDVHAPSFLYVDGCGRRFADETGWEVHDQVRALTVYLPRRANHPHLPGYIVFDEAARLAGPLNGIVGTPNGYSWSADNSAEVDRGWIRCGDTPAQLAAAAGIDAATLSATLKSYAATVAAGRDDAFGRAPETLVALEPPLYAIPMWPGVATASGGPRRDARARVVGADGVAIRGLFAAGAAGSIWGHLTEHGGGLTDAIVFGRIAGAEAAAAH